MPPVTFQKPDFNSAVWPGSVGTPYEQTVIVAAGWLSIGGTAETLIFLGAPVFIHTDVAGATGFAKHRC